MSSSTDFDRILVPGLASGNVENTAAWRRTVVGTPVSASLLRTAVVEASAYITTGAGSPTRKLHCLCAMPSWSSICTTHHWMKTKLKTRL